MHRDETVSPTIGASDAVPIRNAPAILGGRARIHRIGPCPTHAALESKSNSGAGLSAVNPQPTVAGSRRATIGMPIASPDGGRTYVVHLLDGRSGAPLKQAATVELIHAPNVNARLWRFCGLCAERNMDAHGGNRRACPGMSLFAVELAPSLQQEVQAPWMPFHAATQHVNLLNRGLQMSKDGIDAVEVRVRI